MPRKLSPEALAKREAVQNRTTEEVYQDAVKRGLESDVAAERVAAIKAYADERNPGIIEMKDKVKQAEDRAAKAEASLAAVTAERDTAQAILVIAIQSALQGSAAKAELAALKTNFDARVADARKELVSEAQAHEWKALRAENATKDRVAEAESKFDKAGLQLLLDEMKKIVEQYKVPEPALATLPKGISSLILTCWNHSPAYATVALAYARYTEPTEEFKQQLYRVLATGLPVVPTVVMPAWNDEKGEPRYVYPEAAVIPNLAERREVLTKKAIEFGCLQEVQARIDEESAVILGNQRQEQLESLYRQEADLRKRGYGVSPIGVEEKPQVIDPHTWTGYIPANPPIFPDHNERCSAGDEDGPTRK
jgi:hypothetical protein